MLLLKAYTIIPGYFYFGKRRRVDKLWLISAIFSIRSARDKISLPRPVPLPLHEAHQRGFLR